LLKKPAMNVPMKRTLLAAAFLSACSGRLETGTSKPTNAGERIAPGTIAVEPSEPAAGGAVEGTGVAIDSGAGATTSVTSNASDPSAPAAAGNTQLASSDVDAGGGCTALSFLDPTGSVPESGSSLCTRRIAGTFPDCPSGQGQSNSVVIGPAGGTVQLEGQQGPVWGAPFSIEIPPNALSTPTAITVTELAVPPPPGFADWSPLYRVDPVDLVLAAPARLTIPFSNDCCGDHSSPCVSTVPRTMSLFWSGQDTCSLERLPDSYVNAGVEQGSTTRLGFAVVGFVSAGDATYCR
jgi:hypothetical protein